MACRQGAHTQSRAEPTFHEQGHTRLVHSLHACCCGEPPTCLHQLLALAGAPGSGELDLQRKRHWRWGGGRWSAWMRRAEGEGETGPQLCRGRGCPNRLCSFKGPANRDSPRCRSCTPRWPPPPTRPPTPPGPVRQSSPLLPPPPPRSCQLQQQRQQRRLVTSFACPAPAAACPLAPAAAWPLLPPAAPLATLMRPSSLAALRSSCGDTPPGPASSCTPRLQASRQWTWPNMRRHASSCSCSMGWVRTSSSCCMCQQRPQRKQPPPTHTHSLPTCLPPPPPACSSPAQGRMPTHPPPALLASRQLHVPTAASAQGRMPPPASPSSCLHPASSAMASASGRSAVKADTAVSRLSAITPPATILNDCGAGGRRA